ncbi:MAG: hypothetical protein ACREHD_26675, partial [Pirellulales bacterium]
DVGATDDGNEPDRGPARRSLLPSSMGLSVLVPGGVRQLKAVVEWGDYQYEGPGDESSVEAAQESEKVEDETRDGPGGPSSVGKRRSWRREPREETVLVDLPEPGGRPKSFNVRGSGGLQLLATVRLAGGQTLPAGTSAVSVFLLNSRPAGEPAYRAFAFQARLSLFSPESFVPRPDPRAWDDEDDWDERVADLHYRDCCEFGVGHGVSAEACLTDGDRCDCVRTIWIPAAEVHRVAPQRISDVELGMESLGALADGAEAQAKLSPLVAHYRAWIEVQRAALGGLSAERQKTARDMLADAESAAARIESGIALLATDADALEAFRVANRAMAAAARRREWVQGGCSAQLNSFAAPAWYPFQLAFLLMTLRSIAEPEHDEREWVDLLFFPTGGGKTEAYLGLAAFTIVLRRLRNPGVRAAGMTVLMRYTL